MMGLPMSVYKIQFPPGQIKLNKPPHLHGMLAPANTGMTSAYSMMIISWEWIN